MNSNGNAVTYFLNMIGIICFFLSIIVGSVYGAGHWFIMFFASVFLGSIDKDNYMFHCFIVFFISTIAILYLLK
jgi:hypothetical protein